MVIDTKDSKIEFRMDEFEEISKFIDSLKCCSNCMYVILESKGYSIEIYCEINKKHEDMVGKCCCNKWKHEGLDGLKGLSNDN